MGILSVCFDWVLIEGYFYECVCVCENKHVLDVIFSVVMWFVWSLGQCSGPISHCVWQTRLCGGRCGTLRRRKYHRFAFSDSCEISFPNGDFTSFSKDSLWCIPQGGKHARFRVSSVGLLLSLRRHSDMSISFLLSMETLFVNEFILCF